MKGFELSQSKPRREVEQKEVGVSRQLLLASEGGSPSGGEEIQSASMAMEDTIKIPVAFSLRFEVREVSNAIANKNQADFKATIVEIVKDTLDMQPPSNPSAMDTVLRIKGSISKEEERGNPADKMECSMGHPPAQISQIASSQNREAGLLGFSIGRIAIDKQRKSAKSGKIKASKRVGKKVKIGIEPDSQKDTKKGQWTRITNRPNFDLMEEAIHGAEGLKRKASESQIHEESNIVKEKKKSGGGN